MRTRAKFHHGERKRKAMAARTRKQVRALTRTLAYGQRFMVTMVPGIKFAYGPRELAIRVMMRPKG